MRARNAEGRVQLAVDLPPLLSRYVSGTLVSGRRFVQLLVKIEEEQGKAAHADELRARELAHLRLESEVRLCSFITFAALPPHIHTRERTNAACQCAANRAHNRAEALRKTAVRAYQRAVWANRWRMSGSSGACKERIAPSRMPS